MSSNTDSKTKENGNSLDVPQSISHLISSIQWKTKRLLIIRLTEKYNFKPLFLIYDEKNLVKVLQDFETRIKNIIPELSNSQYNDLEIIITTSMLTLDLDSQKEKVRNGIGEKKELKINKYTQNREGPLYESIIVDGKPAFLTLNQDSKEEPIKLLDFIEEDGRIFYPPFREECLYKPYEFPTLEDFKIILNKAKDETIFSLYGRLKNIVSKYIDQENHIINIGSINIIFSYFQDRFNTLHYLGIFGGNDNGKSSIGDVIEALAYRAMNTTDPNAANIFRVIGSVEPGQITLIMDEANSIDQSPELMSILKTGYHYTKFVTRINPNSLKPEKYFAYCTKIIIAEKPPGLVVARGVNDRILPIIAYVGNPMYDIKEIMNPTDIGGEEFQNLMLELEETRNLLFAYRILHFKDPIPNIQTKFKGRNKELTKPYLQLFSNPISTDDKIIYEEVNNTLTKLLEIKNNKKDLLFEVELIPILFKLMHRSKTQIVTFSELWNEIINNVKGHFNPQRLNEFLTEDYGMIYRNSLTYTLEKLGVVTKRRTNFIELIFNQDKLIKAANQYNISVDTSLDGFTINNNEGYEGYEGSTKDMAENRKYDKRDLCKDKDKIDTADKSTIINNDPLKELKDYSREKNEKGIEESPYNPSERSYPSYEESMKEQISKIIYKIGTTDSWLCKMCNLNGDKWFMQVHPCKGLSKISK